MKRWFFILIILATIILPGQAFAAGGPQVVNRDGKISINADHITLGSLLSLWDKATGTKSTVPPELADRKLSVHFSGLSENDAVRAIFLEQPFEYAFVQGQGIIVTSPSSSVAETQPNPPPVAAPPDVGAIQPAPETQNLEMQRMKPQYVPPEQPVTITPSPFGAIVRPEGSEPPLVQLPPVPGAPLPPPFFRPDVPGYTPFGAPYGLPGYTPFGAPYYGPGVGHNMLYDPYSVLP
jgi:hypothetical protein